MWRLRCSTVWISLVRATSILTVSRKDETMSHIEEYNRLIYGETIGWLDRKRFVKELTHKEYQVLLSLLTHRKSRLRWSAADRLGKLGDSRAVEPLIKTLQDTHWLVRLHAAKALGRIGEPIAIEKLNKDIGGHDNGGHGKNAGKICACHM